MHSSSASSDGRDVPDSVKTEFSRQQEALREYGSRVSELIERRRHAVALWSEKRVSDELRREYIEKLKKVNAVSHENTGWFSRFNSYFTNAAKTSGLIDTDSLDFEKIFNAAASMPRERAERFALAITGYLQTNLESLDEIITRYERATDELFQYVANLRRSNARSSGRTGLP